MSARLSLRNSAPLLGAAACIATPSSLPAEEAETGPDQEVVVTGLRSLIHDKLPDDLHDTPQSVAVISQQLMRDQAATRLEDALRNVPGITLNAGEGAARGDTVNLRGFSAFNDFFLDGIRDAAVYDRDSFDLEQVEVVKGPSAILFGRGSTGGAINQVSKAPNLGGARSVSVEGGSNSEGRGTADIDVPIADSAAIRVNLMGETSRVVGRDDVLNRRWGVAPSVAWGIGREDSVTVSYLHQEENNRPDTGIPMLYGRPAPVPRDSYYGLLSDHTTNDVDVGTVRAVHDFSENLSLADTARYGHYVFHYQFAAPNFGKEAIAALPLSAIVVGRDAPDSSGTQTNLTNQTDLTWRVDTGPLTHKLVAGIELARETADILRYSNPFGSNFNWIPATPLLAPNPAEPWPGPQPITSKQDTVAFSQGAYVVDTVSLGQWADLILGLRHDRFAASYDQVAPLTQARLHLDHADDLTSPRLALVLKPTPEQSYYVSYGTSFDPSAEALALTTKTANLGPVKAKTYEVGGKTDWRDGKLTVTGALFHTEVDNAQTNDPDNPTITVLNGNQRVQGAELGVQGHVARHLELFAGYTYLDSATIASGTPAYVGKIMPNVARHAGTVWAEYEISDDWEAGGGFVGLGHRYADSGQTANLPGYVVWNAMVAYRLSDQVNVQLNALNLLDRVTYDAAYYSSTAENHVIPGIGRTVKLTARVTF
jgi:catecholate siderophore receptor